MQGCYTLIRDDDLGLAEFVLDARLTFNSGSWKPAMGGETVYIARYPSCWMLLYDKSGVRSRTIHFLRRRLQLGKTEARSLEYRTLSVSQNILFRYSLSMKNLGLIVYETLKK
jgi:hypothetical protein